MTLSDKHIRLVQAGPEDFHTITALLEECGLYTSSVTPNGSVYWLASLDGRAVGCIGLEVGEGASLLRSAAVLPAYRSAGLGHRLAQAAFEYAAGHGQHSIYLFSTEAGGYWQRYGFVPSSVEAVVAALPDSAQVQSGLTRGWIHEEQVWVKRLG